MEFILPQMTELGWGEENRHVGALVPQPPSRNSYSLRLAMVPVQFGQEVHFLEIRNPIPLGRDGIQNVRNVRCRYQVPFLELGVDLGIHPFVVLLLAHAERLPRQFPFTLLVGSRESQRQPCVRVDDRKFVSTLVLPIPQNLSDMDNVRWRDGLLVLLLDFKNDHAQ